MIGTGVVSDNYPNKRLFDCHSKCIWLNEMLGFSVEMFCSMSHSYRTLENVGIFSSLLSPLTLLFQYVRKSHMFPCTTGWIN